MIIISNGACIVKNKLFFSALSLYFLSSATFGEPGPNKCPGVDAIRNVGINSMKLAGGTLVWMGEHRPPVNYDTNQRWELHMSVNVLFESSAWAAAKNALKDLKLFKGPIYSSNGHGYWTCEYRSENKEVIEINTITYSVGASA